MKAHELKLKAVGSDILDEKGFIVASSDYPFRILYDWDKQGFNHWSTDKPSGEKANYEVEEKDAESLAKLFAAAPEMIEALQWFIDRCDKGEVRSTRTYNRFKEIIKKATE